VNWESDVLAPPPPELIEAEEDAEDDADMEKEFTASRGAGGAPKAHSTGTAHHRAEKDADLSSADSSVDSSDDESDNDEATLEGPGKSGPWPGDGIKELFALQEEHQRQVRAVAQKYGKSYESALRVSGHAPASSRKLSAWHTYLSWTASQDYTGSDPPEDVAPINRMLLSPVFAVN
jgi:hypothetical protein